MFFESKVKFEEIIKEKYIFSVNALELTKCYIQWMKRLEDWRIKSERRTDSQQDVCFSIINIVRLIEIVDDQGWCKRYSIIWSGG